MARTARVVAAYAPHHITQRGNRRQRTSFQENDYGLYLRLMAEWCKKHSVEVWAYCLMPNHVHIVAVPKNHQLDMLRLLVMLVLMKMNLLVLAVLMCSMLSPVDILLPQQSDNAIFVTLDVCHAGSHLLSADSDSTAFCEFARGLPRHEFSGFYRDVMDICSGVLLADRSYPPPRLL